MAKLRKINEELMKQLKIAQTQTTTTASSGNGSGNKPDTPRQAPRRIEREISKGKNA